MAGSEEVLEGFICPICMTDFKAPHQLTKHFEDFHNDDPEILKSLKGVNFTSNKLFKNNIVNLSKLILKNKVIHVFMLITNALT